MNGIPLVVIEAKRPDGRSGSGSGPTVAEGISQCLRNQRPDEIPQLFAYSQLLLSINGYEGRYGTCETPDKFWAAWREEVLTEPEKFAIKNRKLTGSQLDQLFGHRKAADRDWYEGLIAAGELAVTGQDELLISLLSPQRLFEMVRYFTLFDKKAGKVVARYQQVFGIKALIDRINTRKPLSAVQGSTNASEGRTPREAAREGGVIWHTTGSGKLLTMVFLSKTLILHAKKQFGLLIDYRGILAELDTPLSKYQDLGSRTQGGYDIDDIQGLYEQMSTEYKRLPQLYKTLWAIFDGVKNKQDIEQLRAVLVPKMQEVEPSAPGEPGELVDVNLKTRDDFYEALSNFASCLKVALQSATFFEDRSFTDEDRRHYKETVKQLSNLRQLVKQDTGERVDYDAYADQVKKLLDKHVVGVEVREPGGAYEVGKMGQQKKEEWTEEKTRNETDIIKTRVTKMIEQELLDDPYAQEEFSKLLRKVIEEAEQLFDHPMKQYMLFQEFSDQVAQRKLDEVPDAFDGNRHAQAYFGLFKQILPEVFTLMDQQVQDKWIKLAFEVDGAVTQSVAENSINPQNIEADIRKKLLPMMFKEAKGVGAGMDQAKKLVEKVVQITRVGLGKAS